MSQAFVLMYWFSFSRKGCCAVVEGEMRVRGTRVDFVAKFVLSFCEGKGFQTNVTETSTKQNGPFLKITEFDI